ncbi:MAG: crossover junction endodeoxyribonuclease RuvC [Acetanaerobacterium sp.]
MVIMGIDPGYAIVGCGVIDYTANRFKTIDYRAVTTEAGTPFDLRLKQIYDGVTAIIDACHPEALAVEELFFTNNQKTAIAVAEARGVILLAGVNHGVPVYGYTPLQVKQAVVGYGRAVKSQVMEMTRVLLALERVPKPDDVADALAIAICHAHTNTSRMVGLPARRR